MTRRSPVSAVQQAKKRMEEAKRREAGMLAGLGLQSGANQPQLSEEDAKRIAATLMEIMKR
ncbi:hypothetical protein [Imhoffiella purpurea]|uniref:Uncharacterized protein n=1 Tax=Imhoffiella purpurea TaxID=1249627 RepID=W9V7A9_9GAMM|nr:hypothetical protein [Imhoffiella purpurea]EXJ15443.1 hypothetical protein D779_1407 [Imhoffiella purpurea]